ncbi:DUF3301 domain-containing protein [Teredinibacter haidensis]|uniref:DUF3301 domain-containing protein n=1 Tax=Teredinibacter haidensis TaxID=2731755 RepID=UPI000948A39E|nr:DUF3301 domain-containing protein [Teredinibacter haidensis]
MTLYDLAITLIALLLGIAFWQHLGISQRAFRVAKSHTEKNGVTLLDQSIVLRKIALCRSSHSLFAFKRNYSFEFSSVGDVRYRGQITMLGKRLKRIELEPFRERAFSEEPTIEPSHHHSSCCNRH